MRGSAPPYQTDARTDAHTDIRTDVKTVYPPQTKFAGGIIMFAKIISADNTSGNLLILHSLAFADFFQNLFI